MPSKKVVSIQFYQQCSSVSCLTSFFPVCISLVIPIRIAALISLVQSELPTESFFTLFIEEREEHKYVLPTYKVNGLW